ncbi:Ig-like domain-containing protein [Novosphingobium aerophilum]|uniref:Ig-like domain-containing protein n=1 Tax=Novosphingobium aerophilum TaxID=2839843 RepID=UPI003FD1092D
MEKRVEITNRTTRTVNTTTAREGVTQIAVQPGSNVKVVAPPSSVSSMVREGDDLVITFSDGSTIRLDGYFACPADDIGQLSFGDPGSGEQWLVHLGDAACFAPADASTEPLDFSMSPLGAAGGGGIGTGALLALGALGVGGGIALAASGGGGHSDEPVDTTPPAAPTVAATNGTVLSGTAEPGATVRIDINGDGTTDATVTANASGSWTYTPTTPIADGTTVTVRAVDAAGNVSTPASVTVDAAPPAVPTISAAADDVGAIQGNVASGGATDDTRPALSGTAEAGSTVSIYDNGTLIGTATASSTGTWSFTPPSALAQGHHSFTITAKDAVGNVSAASPAYELTVDTASPAAPVLNPTDGITVSGTAEAGTIVSIDVDGDGTPDATAVAGPTGSWSVTLDEPLADGTVVSATATDAAGNSSPAATVTVDGDIDTTPPPVPGVGGADDDTGAIQGNLANGAITDDSTPEFSGSGGEPGSTVSVYDNGVLIGSTTVDGDGDWQFTPSPPLGEGGHSLTFTSSDGDGNESAPSQPFAFTVDTVPPLAATVDPSNGAALTGTAEPGSVVNIGFGDDGTIDGTALTNAAGDWVFVPTTHIPDGTTVSITVSDAAGNSSPPVTVVVDIEAAVAPIILRVVDDAAPQTGTVPSGGLTNDATPTIGGTAEAGSTVSLYDNGVLLGTAIANGSGDWTFTAAALPEGDHIFAVTSVNEAGGVGGPSSGYAVTIDLSAPAAPTLSPTDGVTLSGTAEAGATVTVDTNGDGTPDASVVAGDGGQWSVTFAAPLADGTVVSVIATDAAGNPSPAATTTVDAELDSTPPPVPVLVSATDDVGTVQGPLANGAVTDDTQPRLAGTAEAGVLVSIYDGANLLGTVVADGSGAWNFTPTLAQGAHSLTFTTTDSEGNESQATPVFGLTVDTTAPAAPVINPSNGSLVSGTAEAGAVVRLDLNGNGTVDATVQAGPSGSWSYTPATPLADGSTVIATATDAAGNTSLQGSTTIDRSPPPAPVVTSAADDVGASQGMLVSGSSTDDGQPALSGTAEANSTVSVYDGPTLLGTTTASGAGSWTFTPTAPLSQGTHTLTITATDAVGNVSANSAPFTLTIDNTPPAAPAISSIADDFGDSQGPVSNGGTTDDARPTLTGTSEANATVSVYDNGALLGTTTANGSGAWSFTPVSALGQGSHSFVVTAGDAAGNVSAQSPAYVVSINNSVPDTPAIAIAVDNVGLEQGAVVNGGITNDTQPSLSGTAAPNSTVTILRGGIPVATVSADALGGWNYTPAAPLAQGTYSYTVISINAAGNESALSSPYVVTVDTTPPAAPLFGSANDNVGTVQGPLPSGSVTDDILPTLAGSAEPGATVTIFHNGNAIGTAAVNGLGIWSFTPGTALAEGPHNFTAVATDAAGNVSVPSGTFTLVVDVTPPADPTINPSTGTTLGGTAEPNATINLDLDGNGTVDVTTTANGSGIWTYNPPLQLADGVTVIVTATDAAGNTSAPESIVVDRTAPAAPAIVSVTDDVGPQTGTVANGGATDDTLPVISGTAEHGATVTVYDNGAAIGQAVAGVSGIWTLTLSTPLLSGPHAFTAAATDATGNLGPASPAYTVTLDTSTPAAPVITLVSDDIGATQGTVANGGTTDDSKPTVTGTSAANVVVSVYANGSLLGTTTADGTGAWSFTPTGALSGTPSFTAMATNGAGNVSAFSNSYAVTIDTVPPPVPQITSLTDNAPNITGPITDGGLTNDTTPLISGTSAANATISIFNNGVLLATTTANGSGAWSYTPTLGQGAQSITVSATNSAGNTSGVSSPFAFTIDATAPSAPSVQPSNGQILSGTAEANAFIDIDIGNNGSIDTRVQANASGEWSYTLPSNPGNNTPVSVTAVDAAGNVSGATTITVDAVAPGVPALTAVTDDQGAVVGAVSANGSTDDTLPVLSGTAEGNATVTILDNGSAIGTVQANNAGNWTFTPSAPLGQGSHSITITATDAAGNTGTASAPFVFSVDTNAPPAPTILTVADDVLPQTGTVASGGSTNDTQPVISGTAEAGATITLYINGSAYPATTTADINGDWSFSPVLPEGNYNFAVTATDRAGNVSPQSVAYTVRVDTTAPADPTLNPTDGTTVSGTGEAGAVIQVHTDAIGVPDTTATVDSFGQWSVTFSPTLPNGTEITVVAVDAAGNVSGSDSEIVNTGMNTTPPPIPSAPVIADDVGTTQGPIGPGGVTDDPVPEIHGTAQVGSLVTIYDNGVQIGTVIADTFGEWSISPTLGDGAHSITATATDNGVQSLNSPPLAFEVDTVPPAAPTVNASNGTTLTGTAEAGATVNLDFDGDSNTDASVLADPSGNWTYTPPTPLSNGTVVSAVAVDPAGNASPPGTATIDRAPPSPPAIATVTDDVGPVTGSVNSGGQTDDTRPTLSGTTEGNATVTVYDGATLLGTTTANGAGNWAFTPTTPLGQGSHSFTITATDTLGNVSLPSPAYTVTVVTTAPATPVITGATDDVGSIQGPVASGGVTDDARPTLVGTAPANVTVSIYQGATLVGTTTSNGSGAWSFTPSTPLSSGLHNLTAVATDPAGNQSATSNTYSLTVDNTAPSTPVLASVTDDVGLIQGPLANGATTDDARPTLAGTAEGNATISIFDGATLVGTTTANASGAWSFTPSGPLSSGPHALTVTATDAAGNQSGATTVFNLTVDTSAPTAPVITGAADDVGTTQGPVASGGVTDDATPLLSGTAEANSIVSVYNGAVLLGTATANGAGAWSFTPPSPLSDGPHSFTVTARDAAGNVSPSSTAYVVVVDTTPPSAPLIASVTDDVGSRTGALANGAATDDTRPTLSGTSEANATVSIYDNGTLVGTTTANGSGAWSYTPPAALAQGDHSLTVRATDAAGNLGPASSPFAIRVDTSAPAAPTISSVTDDVGTVQGSVANGGVTNDTVPLLRGTAEAGSTLTLLANGVSIGTTLVDASGNWTFSPSPALGEGTYSFTATATDAAGNTGATSNAFAITVDTTPPSVPVITGIVDDVAPNTGTVANGGVSNDGTPQLTGTASANTAVAIYDNGVVIGSTTSNASGAWTFTPSSGLSDGTHNFTAVAMDTAGNASAASNTYGVTLDQTPPSATIAITTLSVDTGTVGDWSTQDNSPTISGTLGSALGTGEQVQIQIDSGTWVNASVSGTSWYYGPGTLSVGSHAVAVRVVDAAGNVGHNASQTISITSIPAQAPMVQASNSALLGLVGVEALNLLDLGSQSLTAVDPNNNLKTVQVKYAPVLSLALGAYTLTASAALAAELGLHISISNSSGILGIVAPSSTLTITAIDNGAMSNMAVNELLGTVHFEQNLSLLGLDVLNATTITATDTTGLSASAATGSLLDVSLLNSGGSANVIQGDAGANTLSGTTGNDRLYGFAGNDVLNGNDGNDLLRGGAGADTLNGGAGNDTLVYDASDTLIDGGAGSDTLLIDSGTGQVLNLDAVSNIRNIERIDLGTGDAGRQITLTETGVLRATDSNHQLTIAGDGSDRVTMTGAVFQGQTLINGEAYNHYTLGTTDIFVDHPVLVVV